MRSKCDFSVLFIHLRMLICFESILAPLLLQDRLRFENEKHVRLLKKEMFDMEESYKELSGDHLSDTVSCKI